LYQINHKNLLAENYKYAEEIVKRKRFQNKPLFHFAKDCFFTTS